MATSRPSRMFFGPLALLGLSLFLAACGAPAAPPAAPTSAPAAKAADAPSAKPAEGTYEQLLAAAKQEGQVNVWLEDVKSEDIAALNQAFNERTKANIKINHVAINNQDALARLVAGARAGKIDGDVHASANHTVVIFDQEGLVQQVDWVGVFGKEFNKIQQRSDRVNPQNRGKALDFFHLVYGFMYNTQKIPEAEVPRTFDDLAKPQYKGKFMVDPRGTPFNYMAPFVEREQLLALVKRIAANDPLFARGSQTIANNVGTGEATIGLSLASYQPVLARQGAPVGFLPPKEAPGSIENLFAIKGGPHPNAARLFAAWVATDGRELWEKLSGMGLTWQDSGSTLAETLTKFGATVRLAETAEQVKLQNDIGKTLEEIYKSR